MAVAADFITLVTIAATVAGAGVLVYLLWLLLEERSVKRYRREHSKMARLILTKRSADTERLAQMPTPVRYAQHPRLAHSPRH